MPLASARLPGRGPDRRHGPGDRRARRPGVALPRLSFDLLLALIDAAPRVVSHDELMTSRMAGTRRRARDGEPAHQAAARRASTTIPRRRATSWAFAGAATGYCRWADVTRVQMPPPAQRLRRAGRARAGTPAGRGVALCCLTGRGRPRRGGRHRDRVQPHEHDLKRSVDAAVHRALAGPQRRGARFREPRQQPKRRTSWRKAFPRTCCTSSGAFRG